MAAPSSLKYLAKPLDGRQEPGVCGPTAINGDPFAALVGYYADQDCTQYLHGSCIYGYCDGEGCYGCYPANPPATTHYYAKIIETAYDSIQLIYTQDQTCPPNGPGAVFATLIANARCVQMNVGGEAVVSIQPSQGHNIHRKNA